MNSEIALRKAKLEKMYPKKTTSKIIDKFAGDEAVKEKRKNAEEQLSSNAVQKYYAYISRNTYQMLRQALINAMSSRGFMSSADIVNLPELALINKGIKTDKEVIDNKWAEFFVIMVLTPLVEVNEFIENDMGCKDPMNTHNYQYTKTTKPMPSTNADEDPRFALDDD